MFGRAGRGFVKFPAASADMVKADSRVCGARCGFSVGDVISEEVEEVTSKASCNWRVIPFISPKLNCCQNKLMWVDLCVPAVSPRIRRMSRVRYGVEVGPVPPHG